MNSNVSDVIIIGAGAAGLAAAIESSRRGLSSVLLDRNKKPGRKLYATGNGHCNICNDFYDDDCYYGNGFAAELLKNVNLRDFTISYMRSIGVNVTERNGYYYPASMQASTVVWALRDAALLSGASIITDADVVDVTMFHLPDSDDGIRYLVCTADGRSFNSRALIIASGGCSGEKLGAGTKSEAEGLLEKLGVPYKGFEPSLCPVRCKEDLSVLSGVRTSCRISVETEGCIRAEDGELQLLSDGISGIAVFNLVEYIKRGSGEIIINLIPDISEEDFLLTFNQLNQNVPGRSLTAFLNGFINDKLAAYFINNMPKAHGEPDIRELYRMISAWKLHFNGLYSFERSQASNGGILTDVLDPGGMKVRGIGENLYAAGEVIDVIGKCGGYNISLSLYEGYLAGRNCLMN